MEPVKPIIVKLLCFPIHCYRYVIRPVLPCSCRFYPSCSAYALEALQRFGVFKGLYKTVCRLFRCHPWNPGGYDPVD